MQDDHAHLDDELARLEVSLRSGDGEIAFEHFVAFDAELTRYVRGEERILFPVLERFTSVPVTATARMRGEHRSLRKLVDRMGELLARNDKPRALAVLGTLRSVLLLHVAKEEWVLHPLLRAAAS